MESPIKNRVNVFHNQVSRELTSCHKMGFQSRIKNKYQTNLYRIVKIKINMNINVVKSKREVSQKKYEIKNCKSVGVVKYLFMYS